MDQPERLAKLEAAVMRYVRGKKQQQQQQQQEGTAQPCRASL